MGKPGGIKPRYTSWRTVPVQYKVWVYLPSALRNRFLFIYGETSKLKSELADRAEHSRLRGQTYTRLFRTDLRGSSEADMPLRTDNANDIQANTTNQFNKNADK